MFLPISSHHTNSFSHITIKLKNKKVSPFLKVVALFESGKISFTM